MKALRLTTSLLLITLSLPVFAQEAPPLDEPLARETPDANEPVVEEAPPEELPAEPPPEDVVELPVPDPTIHRGPATHVPTAPTALPAPVAPAPEPSPAAATPATLPADALPKAAPAPTPAPEPPPVTADNIAAGTPQKSDDSGEHKFPKFTFSPQVGYAFFPESEYEYDGLKLKVDKRNSFMAKAHLDLGGDGIAFEIAPLFAMEQIGGDLASIGSDLGSGVGGKFFAVGGQVNLVFRGSIGRFYPHIGLGFHGAYLMGDDIQYGAEIYGRIPVGFSIYMGKRFALVVEAAFLYGATGIRGPDPDTEQLAAEMMADYQIDINTIDWQNTSREQLEADYNLTPAEVDQIANEQIGKAIKFGKGAAFEIMVGFRFP